MEKKRKFTFKKICDLEAKLIKRLPSECPTPNCDAKWQSSPENLRSASPDMTASWSKLAVQPSDPTCATKCFPSVSNSTSKRRENAQRDAVNALPPHDELFEIPPSMFDEFDDDFADPFSPPKKCPSIVAVQTPVLRRSPRLLAQSITDGASSQIPTVRKQLFNGGGVPPTKPLPDFKSVLNDSCEERLGSPDQITEPADLRKDANEKKPNSRRKETPKSLLKTVQSRCMPCGEALSPAKIKETIETIEKSCGTISKTQETEDVSNLLRVLESDLQNLCVLMCNVLDKVSLQSIVGLLPEDFRDSFMSAALLRKKMIARCRGLRKTANDSSASPSVTHKNSKEESILEVSPMSDKGWLKKAAPPRAQSTGKNVTTVVEVPLHSLTFGKSQYFTSSRDEATHEDVSASQETLSTISLSPLPALADYGSISPLKLGAHGKFRNFLRDDSASFTGTNYPHSGSMMTALRATFGLKQFRHKQLEAINATMLGHDCFVLMPTGAGKSLCYQLPAVLLPGLTVVVSPLKSLIEDQVQKMQALQVGAVSLSGEISATKLAQLKVQLYQKHLTTKLIYVTPEKLTASTSLMDVLDNMYERKLLARFVIDEAHCVSQWGHDFRPDYKRMSMLRQRFPSVPLMALTATATPKIVVDTKSQLNMVSSKLFISTFVRSNLRYKVIEKEKKTLMTIVSLLKGIYKDSSGIIYCLSRKDCEEVSVLLCSHKIKAEAYHAGQADGRRSKVQREWLMGKVQVICATIAFGMGIDKPDVRFVIHYSLPKSIEGYYQETGRAGRDGLPAHCILFYTYHDSIRLRKLIESESAQSSTVLDMHRQNLLLVVAYAENIGVCRRKVLVEHFGEIYDSAACKADPSTACDVCMNKNPPSLFDYTEDACLILHTFQTLDRMSSGRCTLRQLADVYRGANTKVMSSISRQTQAYGRGAKLGVRGTQRVMHHLICEQIFVEQLFTTAMDHMVSYLKLGPQAQALLSGNKKVHIYLESSGGKNEMISAVTEGAMAMEKYRFKHTDISERCLESLTNWLCQVAEAEGLSNVNAILSADALRQIACWLPRTQSELLGVDTMTEGKLRKYGSHIMNLLEPFWNEVDQRESERMKQELLSLEQRDYQRTQRSVMSGSSMVYSQSTSSGLTATPADSNGFVKASSIARKGYGYRGRGISGVRKSRGRRTRARSSPSGSEKKKRLTVGPSTAF